MPARADMSAGTGWKGTTIAVQLPKMTWALATAYAAAIAVSAATNAAECVLTTANNTFSVGDFVEFTSGWSLANNCVFRVKAATTTSVTLEQFDTTLTNMFPAGGGAGSVRKITTWVPIIQVLGTTSSGGDPSFVTYQFQDQDNETQIPAGNSAQSLSMDIGDDPTLPHHKELKVAAFTKAIRALRGTVVATGSILLYNAIVSFNETPSMTPKQIMAVKAGYALQSNPTRYAS